MRPGKLARLLARGQAAPAPAPTVASCLTPAEQHVLDRCQPHTMASAERIVATVDAVAYVVDRRVDGALVECGVWRGGSVLAMVLTLQSFGVTDRDVFLCDTFEGMTEPSAKDTSPFDRPALHTYSEATAQGERAWEPVFGAGAFGLEQVRELLHSTGYPRERLHFVVGPVEETLPAQAPDEIALLRLDTDWYSSTKHEMEHLYPRIAPGGVLLVDDYGHWEGARQAVEEHFAAHGDRPLLARTDYTGRMAVKL